MWAASNTQDHLPEPAAAELGRARGKGLLAWPSVQFAAMNWKRNAGLCHRFRRDDPSRPVSMGSTRPVYLPLVDILFIGPYLSWPPLCRLPIRSFDLLANRTSRPNSARWWHKPASSGDGAVSGCRRPGTAPSLFTAFGITNRHGSREMTRMSPGFH